MTRAASRPRTSSWPRRWSGSEDDKPDCGGNPDANEVTFAMAFFQEPPRLGNQFDDDPMLVSWIARFCPEVAGELRAIGDVAVEYHAKQLADRENEPVLTQWDAWGHRIDKIEVSPLWREAQGLAARVGMGAAGYDRRFGAHAATHQ